MRNAPDENLRSYAFSEEGFARLKELTKAKKQTLSRVVDDLVREDALKGWPSGPHPPWLRAKIAAREKHGSDPAELECALVNFVNAGDSELAVPSLYSTRWTLITLRCESHLERALRKAFHRHLTLWRLAENRRYPLDRDGSEGICRT